ncbi:hypothetical protein LCGC14_2053570 [marine sediment metagenome]|uniref:Uncharacterized protein n=1 Tax=marine sediment metagenome TaxID=412755 RepID=A0A0F9EN92_9ZZZZ
MSFIKLLMSVPDSAVTMKNLLQLNVPGNQFDVEGLDKIIGDMIDGSLSVYAKLSTGATQASGAVTFIGIPTVGDTVVIAGFTFTAVAGAPSSEFEFQIGADVSDGAAKFVAALTASITMFDIVDATSLAGVVTLLAAQPGIVGVNISLTKSSTQITTTIFSGGSDGDQVAVNFGKAAPK